MPDTAKAIARDLIDDIGYLPAVCHMLDQVVTADSWQRFRQGLRLLAAVVFK